MFIFIVYLSFFSAFFGLRFLLGDNISTKELLFAVILCYLFPLLEQLRKFLVGGWSLKKSLTGPKVSIDTVLLDQLISVQRDMASISAKVFPNGWEKYFPNPILEKLHFYRKFSPKNKAIIEFLRGEDDKVDGLLLIDLTSEIDELFYNDCHNTRESLERIYEYPCPAIKIDDEFKVTFYNKGFDDDYGIEAYAKVLSISKVNKDYSYINEYQITLELKEAGWHEAIKEAFEVTFKTQNEVFSISAE